MVKLLIKNGALVNHLDGNNFSVIHMATLNNSGEIIEIFWEKSVKINQQLSDILKTILVELA